MNQISQMKIPHHPKTSLNAELGVNILSRWQRSGLNLLTLLLMTSNVDENMALFQCSRERSCG